MGKGISDFPNGSGESGHILDREACASPVMRNYLRDIQPTVVVGQFECGD